MQDPHGIKRLLALSTMSAMLVLAGCGGDSGNGDSASAASSSAAPLDLDPSGLGPNSAGKYANAEGFYPDASGRYPDAYTGLYPDANGVHMTPQQAGIFENEHGRARSYSTAGPIDTNPATNPFFKPLGNGRSCATCHDPADGFTVTPKSLKARFDATAGQDPIFRPVDGSNAPNADVSTPDKRKSAYSMLLDRGVIRIQLAMPATADFTIESVTDPYQYASPTQLSLFRRVLPSTNLKFLGAVMWDERETLRFANGVTPYCQNASATAPCFEWPFNNNLKRQANGAVTGHAEFSAGLTQAEQDAIVDFELTLFTAQEYDNNAKFLAAAQAKGGARELSTVDYYFDIFGAVDPKTGESGLVLKAKSMQLFNPAWTNPPAKGNSGVMEARASIARGEKLFNTRTFTINGVAGTNGTTVTGATCTNCHRTPQVGSLSVPNSFALGISDPAWNPQTELPLYTLKRKSNGQTVTTYDPGLALVTGKWGDIGKFKTPGLRGLATRAPYFHDGSAKTIEDTTVFYNKRFNMNMTAQEMIDLNNFLRSL